VGCALDFEGVYGAIKELITNGTLQSGSAVSQLALARILGVSRTPIREALRRLEAEGLLDGKSNRRMRVTEIKPEELDAMYSIRIFLESMGIALTVPRLNADDLDMLKDASRAIEWDCAVSDPPHHNSQLAHFKLLAMKYAGDGVRAAVSEQFDRCERIRKIYQGISYANVAFARNEHNALLNACLRRSVDDATFVASRHLGRTGLAVIGFIAPDYEPKAIRFALAKVAFAAAQAASVLNVDGKDPNSRKRTSSPKA
jgi:DNA-binding GntR family transcriptional regulator